MGLKSIVVAERGERVQDLKRRIAVVLSAERIESLQTIQIQRKVLDD